MDVVAVTLETVCEGDLARRFNECVPQLVRALRDGEKATIAIALEIKRVPDTTTMCQIKYSMRVSTPAVKKASICQIGDKGQLLTDPPRQPLKVVNLFEENREVHSND